MHAPEVIDEYIESREKDDQECAGPLGFEPSDDHATCGEANYGDEDTRNRPLPLDDESNEEEDEEHATCQLEAMGIMTCQI
jgi:hypothetical protein